jgi:hypothetical protein
MQHTEAVQSRSLLLTLARTVYHDFKPHDLIYVRKKVKISLLQAMETYRVARG